MVFRRRALNPKSAPSFKSLAVTLLKADGQDRNPARSSTCNRPAQPPKMDTVGPAMVDTGV